MSNLLVPKFAIAIDWETSGYSYPNFAEKHQGISFGAIIFDVNILEPVEELYLEVQFNDKKYLWEAGAEKVHGISREHLKKNGIPQEDAALELGNLILKYIGTEDPMILAHRAYFDIAFSVQLMKTIDIDIKFNPTPIDTSVFGMILMETSKSDTIFETLGMAARGKHNALEDIRNTLQAIREMKKLFLAGATAELQ